MKKVKLLALAAAFVLGLSSMGNAAELKVKGEFQASAHWTDNYNFRDGETAPDGDGASEDDFHVRQRMRVRFQYVQSETLQAVMHLEVGDQVWGKDNYGNANGTTYQVGKGSGGGLSADGVAVEVKNAYLDFNIPDTLVNLKVGIQGMVFPSTVFGNQIMDDDVAGVVVSAPINEMVGVTFAWARPIDVNAGNDLVGTNGSNQFDETDVLLLAVPITPEGMKITPWAAMAIIGNSAYTGGTDGSNRELLAGITGAQSLGAFGWLSNGGLNTALGGTNNIEETTYAYWAGLAFEMSMFDPIVVAADVQWGTWKADLNTTPAAGIASGWDEIKNSGWLADLSIKYKGLDFGTPELFGIYASGNGSDALEDGKFGMLPALKYGPTNTGAFAVPGGFYYGGTAFATTNSLGGYVADPDNNVQGTWAAGVALRDFSFLEKLTHTLIVMYIGGTNDEDFVTQARQLASGPTMGNQLLSTKDHIWEVDFNHQYKIYEQLSAIMELGFMHPDFDEDVWGAQADETKDAWRVSLGLIYKF